jgi:hypothetical protein
VSERSKRKDSTDLSRGQQHTLRQSFDVLSRMVPLEEIKEGISENGRKHTRNVNAVLGRRVQITPAAAICYSECLDKQTIFQDSPHNTRAIYMPLFLHQKLAVDDLQTPL